MSFILTFIPPDDMEIQDRHRDRCTYSNCSGKGRDPEPKEKLFYYFKSKDEIETFKHDPKMRNGDSKVGKGVEMVNVSYQL